MNSSIDSFSPALGDLLEQASDNEEAENTGFEDWT